MQRVPVLAAAAIVLLPVVAPAADPPLTRPQVACVLAMNTAGARVAAAAAEALRRCVRDTGRGRLRSGQTADQCVEADDRGRVARARARASTVYRRKCGTPPPLGAADATVVADAFAELLSLAPLFGPTLHNTLIRTVTDKAGAACQLAVVKAMSGAALARLAAFHACVATGVRRGTITTAAGLRTCAEAQAKGRAGSARAVQAVRRRCARVDAGVAFPGPCGARPAEDVLLCLAQQTACGLCVALNRAERAGLACSLMAPSCGGEPPDTSRSVARQWNDEAVAAIRRDNPRPPVHARNLFHLAVAMYDAWAAYDATAAPYLARERATSADVERDRTTAISYAAYRLLSARYATSLALGAEASRASFDARMEALGLDAAYAATTDDGPAALGNRVAAAVIAAARTDGANEPGGYADAAYAAVNAPLVVKLPDIDLAFTPDANRWQPLALDAIIGQNGVPIPGRIQTFVGSQWGDVTPFALARLAPGDLDPGSPPQLGGPGDEVLKREVREVIEESSRLSPDDPATTDASPAAWGDNPLGTDDGRGHAVNPATGLPYAPHVVRRGDFQRVVAELWTDGPEAETIPGYWNVLANRVADTPGFARRLGGTGPSLGALEWDVKTYFALNAALHDAAIAAWRVKRAHDRARPITMVRYMAKKGQSSDPAQASYDPSGLPLAPGLIELITAESAAAGGRHAHLVTPDAGGRLGEVAILAWPGAPTDPREAHGGVRWLLARGWRPYQRATFVTPPFPGYVSAHSALGRAAAAVLAAITGDPYFPGGLAEVVAPRDAFLQFERGPSSDVRVQWATYYDAADQAGRSRVWAGVHVGGDDLAGRRLGHLVGRAAFDEAMGYFAGTATR